MARLLRKPMPGMRIADSDGSITPEFQRFLYDWHGALSTNQKATDAAVIASTPAAVEPSGAVIVYRPTRSTGNGYDQPAAAYDGNSSTPATATIEDVAKQQRTWLGFTALQGAASALALKVASAVTGIRLAAARGDVVNSAAIETGRSGTKPSLTEDAAEISPVISAVSGGALATLEYSFDAGATWKAFYRQSLSDAGSDTIAVPLSTRLSSVQVRATAEGKVSGAKLTHKILEIWIEVTP